MTPSHKESAMYYQTKKHRFKLLLLRFGATALLLALFLIPFIVAYLDKEVR